MTFIFTSENENLLVEKIKSVSEGKKVVFVADSVPLISNLNLYENITLPLLFHGLDFEEAAIDDKLKEFELFEKKYFRKSGLSDVEVFFAKYLMCHFYNPDFIVFVYQFHHFSGQRDRFYNFFNDENDEKFVIIEREIYESLLADKIENFKEMSFEEWLKNSLNI